MIVIAAGHMVEQIVEGMMAAIAGHAVVAVAHLLHQRLQVHLLQELRSTAQIQQLIFRRRWKDLQATCSGLTMAGQSEASVE